MAGDDKKPPSGYIWVAGYHNDDPFGSNGDRSYFRIFKKAIPFYCSHHVYRQENIQEYQRLGIKHVKQLKSYYLPWIDQPPEADLGG